MLVELMSELHDMWCFLDVLDTANMSEDNHDFDITGFAHYLLSFLNQVVIITKSSRNRTANYGTEQAQISGNIIFYDDKRDLFGHFPIYRRFEFRSLVMTFARLRKVSDGWSCCDAYEDEFGRGETKL